MPTNVVIKGYFVHSIAHHVEHTPPFYEDNTQQGKLFIFRNEFNRTHPLSKLTIFVNKCCVSLYMCVYIYIGSSDMYIYYFVKKIIDMHCVTPKTEVTIRPPITDGGIVILVFMYFNFLRMTT
jgi:hypothetical protein